MSGIGAASFVEGLQGGIAARDKMDLNRRYKRLLDREEFNAGVEHEGLEDVRSATWMKEKGSMEGYEPTEFMPEDQDPVLMRSMKFIGSKIKGFFGGGKGEEAAAETITEGVPSAGDAFEKGSKAPGAIKMYADGGRIEDQYAMDAMDVRGAYRPPNRRAQEEALEPRPIEDEPIFPRTRGMVDAYGKTAIDLKGQYDEAGSPAEKGDLLRQRAGNRLAQAGSVGAAYARDMVDFMVPDDLVEGVGGFLGFDGDPDAQAAAPAQAAVPPPQAAEDKGAAAAATVETPDKSNEEVAQQAIDTGGKVAAENFDYRMLPPGTTPKDLPSYSTDEWVEYRTQMLDGLLKQGKDVNEAYNIVDEITVGQQIKGMTRELQKAEMYLQVGDLQSAGFAVRQGYQYFPNGLDVEVAIQTGKNGEQALVTIARDEKTGEMMGSPTLVTAETVSAMRDNFSDPSVLRTWAKDGREQQMKLAEQSRKDADTRSMMSFREESAKSDRIRAEASMAKALTPGSPGGGVRESDLRASEQNIVEYVFRNTNIPEEMAPQVEEAATIIRRNSPSMHQVSDIQIANLVMAAAEQGQIEDLLRALRQGAIDEQPAQE